MRETEHNALDEPTVAAQFVLDHLPGIDQDELGELFGVDPRTVREWKAGTTKQIARIPTVSCWLPNSFTTCGEQ